MAELFLRECEKLPGLGVFGIFLHGDFKLTSGVGKAAGYVQRLRVGEAYLRRQLLFGDLTEHLHGFLRLGATQKREGQLRLCLTVGGMFAGKVAQQADGFISFVVLDEQIGLKRYQGKIVGHLGGSLPDEWGGVFFAVVGEQPDGRVDDGRGRGQSIGSGAEFQQAVGGVNDGFAVVAAEGAVELELSEDEFGPLRGSLRRKPDRREHVVLSGDGAVARGAACGQQQKREGGGEHQALRRSEGRQTPPDSEKGWNMGEHGCPVRRKSYGCIHSSEKSLISRPRCSFSFSSRRASSWRMRSRVTW